MAETATPETGTETATPTGPISDAEAIDLIGKRFESPADDQAPDEETPQTTPSEESRAQAETEDKADESEEEATLESEEVKAEAEEAEEELPSTLSEWAEALEMSPADLAEHLKVNVKVPGAESEVTLAEALKGYSREADYTQGTQRLSEERKALAAERDSITTQWQQRIQELDGVVTALASHVLPEPGFDLVAQFTDEDGMFDAPGYHRAKAQQDAVTQALTGAWQQVEQNRSALQQQQIEQITAFRTEQQRLAAEKIPALREPESVRKFESDATEMLKSVGFSPDEIGGVL